MAFNRALSQLEAIHQIGDPVLKVVDPSIVQNYIINIFEAGIDFTSDWFISLSERDISQSVNIIHNLLQESELLISKRSIMEGIELYIKGNIDEA